MRFPASHGSFRIRFSLFDVLWAAASAPLALYLRNVIINTPSRLEAAELYCALGFAASLIAFLFFRIREGLAHHFSVHDALDVAKAVVAAELLTTLVMFTAVRMDGIPRSTPVIHALILATGLILYRIVIRLWHEDRAVSFAPSAAPLEHIVIVGGTRLSSLYARMLRAYAPQKYKVVAILDNNPRAIGKSIDGVRIIGPPEQLSSIIEEFAEHGIAIDRVLVGGGRSMLSPDELDSLGEACAAHNAVLDFISTLVGLEDLQTAKVDQPAKLAEPQSGAGLSAYFRYKRVADVILGLILVFLLLPLFIVIAALVLLDVGSPVFFWQQRLGMGGRPFLLHKFRTYKPLFNERGLPIGTTDRVSWIGSFLRNSRLDELPQLLNVLVGDMSLVGPRPLLPQDQPENAEIRLAVRPGITGWAQINGGKSISSAKKSNLDEWYVRHASFWLDLRILLMTFKFVAKGERQAEQQPVIPQVRPAIKLQNSADMKMNF